MVKNGFLILTILCWIDFNQEKQFMSDYVLDLIYEIKTCPEDYQYFGLLMTIAGLVMLGLGIVLVMA